MVGVLAAVRFDDQALGLANEIDDKGSDWLLSAKLGTANVAASEHRPKSPFGVCHVSTQAFGFDERLLAVAGHALTLPPLRGSLPLPRGERG